MALRMLLTQRVRAAAIAGRHVASTSAAFTTDARVFPSFTTYGSDSVFQVSPNPPQYQNAPTGTYLKTKRAGSIMLSWAKATNSGYNYQNKAFFSLSPSEIGLLLELLDARMTEMALTHSPNMNASDDDDRANKRTLNIQRTTGGDGHPAVVFTFTGEFQAGAALNAGEARTLRELLIYSLPRLFGFHTVLEGPLNVEGVSNNSNGYANNNSSSNNNKRTNAKPAAEWPF